jgi:hemolysin activation/secretion protein
MKSFAAHIAALSLFLPTALSLAHATDRPTDLPSRDANGQQLNMLSVTPKIVVYKFLFTGNTAVSTSELSAISEPYLNRELTIQDLEALRQALIQRYIGKGFINSGVIIPDQKVEEGNRQAIYKRNIDKKALVNSGTIASDNKAGVVSFTVIEGGLNKVAIEGLRHYRQEYLSAKLNSEITRPLNVNNLQESLQLLQQDHRIKQINAELLPGTKPGDAELKVKINEASPFKVSTRFSNDASPSSGSYKGELILAHQNLLGFGDTLSATTALTEGAVDYGGRYSFPISLHDTTLDMYYNNSSSKVIEEQFKGLDISSNSETIGFKIRQPFLRSVTDEFALTVAGEKRHSVSKLFGEKFSFSAGEQDGESKVSVMRFSQEWTHRTPTFVGGVYSTLSVGVPVLGATTHAESPDSRFVSWIGQGMVLSRLGSTAIQGLLRTSVQLSFDRLLPLEKFPLGGLGTVRGYRSNTVVRDNGVNSTGELRIPLISNDNWPGTLQLVPFIDFGRGWDNDASSAPPKALTSAGCGLRWQWSDKVTAEVYYGYDFNKINVSNKDLQDQGVHFLVNVAWL